MNADAYKYIRYNASQETRWATVEEIHRSCSHINLSDQDYSAAGLPIMSDGKEAYVDNADTHSLIFGATGSKKTRLFCMPMINIMAKAGESFIVTDPKGELYAQTSGLVKSKGYKTVVLNFRDLGKGDMWNPLSLPYELWKNGYKDEAGLLLSDIASTIANPMAQNSKDSYWAEAAQEMAIAGFYVLMESAKKEEVNMKSFANISSQSNIKNVKKLTKMMREDSVAAINYNSTACLDASSTVAGIVGNLHGMLRVFTVNDKLSQMLSDNTFDMRMFGKEKTAVYIIVPDEKTTYHFLVTMFLKQVYEIMIAEAQKEENRSLPVRVNFVLDEFCNIPQIPDMPSMISAARSRNMRYFLVVQSIHQLKGRYGEDADTIKGNCDNWVFLTSKELDLLNEISELCGNIVTPDGQQRRLISTSELQRFDKAKGEALIMHSRQYPIISEMADISQYSMYGIYAPEVLNACTNKAVACFSMANLLEFIDNHEAIAPFASESHMLYQAQCIYKEELKKLGVEDSDDDEDEDEDDDTALSGIASFMQRMLNVTGVDNSESEDNEDNEDDSTVDEDDASEEVVESEEERIKREAEETAKKAAQEKERKEKVKVARANAKVRIAALMGDEYAKRFFEENLKNTSADSDDDDDLFDF